MMLGGGGDEKINIVIFFVNFSTLLLFLNVGGKPLWVY